MTIDSNKIAVATGLAFAIIWLFCSALVAFLPELMMGMSGHMVHANLGTMSWSMSFGGFFIGLVLWSFVSALTAWVMATIYNKL